MEPGDLVEIELVGRAAAPVPLPIPAGRARRGDPRAPDAAVGAPVDAGGGPAGAEDDIDAEGVVGGVADLVGDGVLERRARRAVGGAVARF